MSGDVCIDEHYVGWMLDSVDRGQLLGRFPPRWPVIVPDHVTLCREGDPAARNASHQPVARVIGIVTDDRGVEALMVELDGSPSRPNGGVYHLTWSLALGRRAAESNDVISTGMCRGVSPPLPLALRWGSWPASRYP